MFSNKVYHNSTNKINKYENSEGPLLPIIYSKRYGVHFCGLQKLHPFDAEKGHHIMKFLKEEKFLSEEDVQVPNEIEKKDLLKVHTKKYLKSLKWSWNVAKIAEIPLLVFVPNSFVQNGYLRPMRFQTAGSILAGKLALQYGWSINLGGGFHHCSADKGGGFCPYADITLLIRNLLEQEDKLVKNVMIIDLDAHQGNGHERDFINNANIYILDMYNAAIYPRDHPAKLAIRCAVELKPRTPDKYYLNKLKKSLNTSFNEFQPDLIVYNAGTDVLQNDPLGLLDITPEGVIERDEIVFSTAISKNVPIAMLLSGGYLKRSAKVIADSILNLKNKNLLIQRVHN
ncbi:histone deacetylase 11 [Condylostylus longicornis]|uniref:histone deacetylase 11 n=1 Tax=Condylostylus longicornis TaxID=2530218 RepID=UPI00244E0E80|nr:histone deacetylase 11 [Condylostylus longicornis]